MADEKSKRDPKSGESKALANTETPAKVDQPGSTGGQGSTGSKDFQKKLNDELQNYIRSLQEIYNEGMKRAGELNQEFLKAQKEEQTILDENLKEDYRNFITTVQQLWGQENAQTKIEDAYRNFLVSVNDRQMEAKKNFEDLCRNYSDTLQKHTSGIQENNANAYHDFLKAFQTAWSNADVESFDSSTLASVGQIMITASNLAGPAIPVK